MEAKHKNEEARKAKKGKKEGNDQFGAPGRHLGSTWAPLQIGGALGTPLGAIGAQGAPVGATWAPLCSKKISFANLGFLHPI